MIFFNGRKFSISQSPISGWLYTEYGKPKEDREFKDIENLLKDLSIYVKNISDICMYMKDVYIY